MKDLLSKREYGGNLPRMKLHSVWYVEADASYRVSKKTETAFSHIAVRTLNGMGKLQLEDGAVFELTPGSAAVFDARQPLRYWAGEEGWQFYWFEFDAFGPAPALLNRMVYLAVSAQEQAALERCFQSLSRSGACECMMAESLFACLLTGWQLISEEEEGSTALRNVIPLLEKGRRERLSVAELAREAGMCERSFRGAVRAVTGLSPKGYMLKGEMTAAMELLRTTDMSVSEIAASLNYVNPFYFSRVFKKYYGVSPQQAKRNISLQTAE